MSRTTRVGVIGLGATGSTVARRLLDAGFDVTVQDRDACALATMARTGARPARTPADAAEPAQLVFVHVPDEPATDEVLFDRGGVGETLRDGGIVVLAAATGSAFVTSAADRLAALGLWTVEAWFTGDPGSPATTVFVGGSPRVRATVAPALRAVAAHVVPLGPLGSVGALRTAVTALSAVPPVASRVGRAGSTAAPVGTGAPVDGSPLPSPRQDGRSSRPGTAPGVLTVDELMDVVDTVRRRGHGRPASCTAAVEPRSGTNCLGLPPSEFGDVVTELERSCGIPLLGDAVRCSTPGELVSLVNSQVASDV